MMSVVLYYGNLKILTKTVDNKMPTVSGMETKNEIKIVETTIKKMGPIWNRSQKRKKNESNKVVDI